MVNWRHNEEGKAQKPAAHARSRRQTRQASSPQTRIVGGSRRPADDDGQASVPGPAHAPVSGGGVPDGASSRGWRVRSTITRWRMFGVVAFGAIMALGGLVGLLFFARPTSSAVEMRNLTTFPEFTVESFLDGSFFTDVSLWYADTYPLREPMVSADHAIDGLFGVAVDGAMVGGNVVADQIPVEESEATPSATAVTPPAAAPDERVVAEDIQNNIMEGVYVRDGAAYSIYYFDQNAADAYIAAMNTAAEKLDGIATVYSIMSPANSITLDADEAQKVGGSDQQQTLDYLATRYDKRVKQVEIVDDIIEHRSEYLYFYTDHHWTQLGAYYAYVAFCKEKGIEPRSLDSWRHENFGVFHGTYYDTLVSVGGARDDTVDAWVPSATNTIKCWPDGSDGEMTEVPIVDEAAAEWEAPMKYSCFLGGDEPLEIAENPNLHDGSSCLVVKDSYGNAFAPLLVDSYQTVYVIDFRETDKNICDYVRENNIQDVIFLTGMKIGLTESVANTLLSEVS